MPYIQNVEFQNETGQTLAGRLYRDDRKDVCPAQRLAA